MAARLLTIICAALLVADISRAEDATVSASPEVKRLAVRTPPPDYPLEARKRCIAGHGVFLLRVQIGSGRVTQVIVGLSTGSGILDDAAVHALSQWQFRPGAVPYRKITSVPMSPPQTSEEALVKVPVTFTLTKT